MNGTRTAETRETRRTPPNKHSYGVKSPHPISKINLNPTKNFTSARSLIFFIIQNGRKKCDTILAFFGRMSSEQNKISR
jgi:hypothetical protein